MMPQSEIAVPAQAPVIPEAVAPPVAGHRNRGGRPKGARNKVPRELKHLIQKLDRKLLREVERIATTADSEALRLQAIQLLWDRGHGKPAPAPVVEVRQTQVNIRDDWYDAHRLADPKEALGKTIAAISARVTATAPGSPVREVDGAEAGASPHGRRSINVGEGRDGEGM